MIEDTERYNGDNPNPNPEETLSPEQLEKIFGDSDIEVYSSRIYGTLQVEWGERGYEIVTDNPEYYGLTKRLLYVYEDERFTREEYELLSPFTFALSEHKRLPIDHDEDIIPEVPLIVSALLVGGSGLMSRRKALQILGTLGAAFFIAIMISHNSRPKNGFANGGLSSVRESISDSVEDRYSLANELQALFEARKLLLGISAGKIIKDKVILPSQFGIAPLRKLNAFLNEYKDQAAMEMLRLMDSILESGKVEFAGKIPPSAFETVYFTIEAFPAEQRQFMFDWELMRLFEKYDLVGETRPGLEF